MHRKILSQIRQLTAGVALLGTALVAQSGPRPVRQVVVPTSTAQRAASGSVASPVDDSQAAAMLTLEQAVAAALENNPSMKLAAAEMASSEAGYKLARVGLLPKIGFSEKVTDSNNPVYVFGTKLLQQDFQASDFSLQSLNHPDPRSNFATSVSGYWRAFDFMQTRNQIRSAALMRRGSEASADRSQQEVIFRVVRAYQGVLVARRQVEVAEHAVDTAQKLYEQSRSRVEAGVAVESDALSAQVNLAQRQQEWIAAQGEEQSGWAELEAAMGTGLPYGPESLVGLNERSFAVLPLEDEVSEALRSRADLKSMTLQVQAQQAAVKAARASYGPRIDMFGSWETNRETFAGDGGSNWTAGAELRVDLLPLETRARVAQQRAALDRARAGEEAALSQVRVEVSQAYYAQQAAAKMVEVARSSMAQATESLRILRNRYDAGLVTLTEVLRAEDAERQSRNGYWRAVHRNAVSYAALRLATGTLNREQLGSFQ